MPEQPLPTGLEPFLSSVDAWWKTPARSGATMTVEQALAAQMATVMEADATLRALDRTLPQPDADRITAVMRSLGRIVPTETALYDILFDGMPYPGALAIAGNTPDKPVLLFMPDRGWDRFPSLPRMHEELEERIRHELISRDTLPGLRVSDVDRMIARPGFVASRPAGVDIFSTIIRRVAAVQRRQVTDAWEGLSHGDDAATVADSVRAALDIHARLDIDAMHADRLQRVLALRNAARLARVPAPVREAWHHTASELRSETDEGLRTLKAHGVSDAIDPPEGLQDPDAVRHYRDQLLAAFDPRRDGRVRRDVAARLMRARLAMAAADARLGYYLPEDRPGFRDDHAERGYQWLHAVHSAPVASGRPTVEGHDIVVRQFTYRGAVVGDLLAIGARQRDSVSTVVLYTPDTPDGRDIREFADAAEAAREFLYHPRFETWLLDRLPASHASADTQGNRHFAIPDGTRRATWIVGQSGGEGFTATAEAFGEREIQGHVFEANYASVVARMLLDLSELEASLREQQAAPYWRLAGIVQDALSPGPAMVREMFTGLGRGMRALWRVEDALRSGDYTRAFLDATEAYVNLLGTVPIAHVAVRPWVYLRGVAGASWLPGAARATRSAAGLDPRYAAPQVSLLETAPDAQGIHALGPRRYVVSGNVPYEVRFDRANLTWRLTRPGAPDTHYTGPAIRREGGQWGLRPDMGLRGGRRLPGSPPPSRIPIVQHVAEADYTGLTAHQRSEFLRVLRQRLGGTAADDLHIEVLMARGRPVPVGRTRWSAWSDALEAARRAPMAAPRGAPVPLVVEPPWREIPAIEWPDSVWYYPPDFVTGLERPSIYLPLTRVRGSGFSGLAASPLDPALRQAMTGVMPPRWVQIHLDRLRPQGTRGFRVFLDDTAPQPHYVLRGADPDPGTFLVLRPGQFTVGQPAVP